MKPDPILPTLAKPLTERDQLYLRLQRFRPKGVSEFNAARKLERLGLGELTEGTFTVSPAGAAMAQSAGN